jgi:hypothetical protein
VRLDWMMLANYAEVAPNGLVYVAGGSWDTTTVHQPLPPEAPDEIVAVLQGHLVARILFHVTETEREHGFQLTVLDEDGGEVARFESATWVARVPGLPPSWDHGVNLALGLSGVGLPRFGLYTLALQVDGQHLGDRPFRAVQGWAPDSL